MQLLQISHSFNPGVITIQENEFHALSIGNEVLQKVIVLILSRFEDASDFEDLLQTINKAVSDNLDSAQLARELERLYYLSHSVFKAREAVLTKLAEEVTDLKNKEMDVKLSLEWLISVEQNTQLKAILVLMRYGALKFDELRQLVNISEIELGLAVKEMETQKIIEIKDGIYYLLIHYLAP